MAEISVSHLQGSVDRFVAPRLLSGWVRDGDRIGKGLDITLAVYQDDRLLAEGRPTKSRPDIVDEADYLTEFRLLCVDDVTDSALALGRLRIVATATDGRSSDLPIWDVVRGQAFERLFATAPSIGAASASALLRLVGESVEVAPDCREAVRSVLDKYFSEDHRQLVSRFESIGMDCSLGSIQRAYGAEPLGLFRFAGIGAEAATAALHNSLSGIGDPEFTRLIPGDNGEYFTSDTRYHMSSHTFVFEGDIEFDIFYQQCCRKLSFSARNFSEKLEDGEKILVVHALPDQIDEVILTELHAAIRKHGTCPLLYLMQASDAFPVGTVQMRPDGIIVGSVLQIQGELINPIAEVREAWLSVLSNVADFIR